MKYLLVENGKETGPFTRSELQARVLAGEIFAETVCIPKTLMGTPCPLSRFFPDAQRKPAEAHESTEAAKQQPKTAGVAITAIGLLLMVFGAIQWSSAASQIKRAFGQTDVLGILLFIGGGIALLVGLSRLLSSPGSSDPPPSTNSVEERLRRLDDLRSRQIISASEYEQQRKEIIGSL